jgi:hypothetical protein
MPTDALAMDGKRMTALLMPIKAAAKPRVSQAAKPAVEAKPQPKSRLLELLPSGGQLLSRPSRSMRTTSASVMPKRCAISLRDCATGISAS